MKFLSWHKNRLLDMLRLPIQVRRIIMIEVFHKLINIEIIIWLFPIMFMFHALEEIITIESFITKYRKQIPDSFFAKLILTIKKRLGEKSAKLAISMAWILLLISFITVMNASLLPIGPNFLVFLAIFNLFFLQAFSHVGQTIIFRDYTPGVITALFIVIPYSFLTYYRLFELGFIDKQLLFKSIPLSVLMIPIFLIGNLLGQKLIRFSV